MSRARWLVLGMTLAMSASLSGCGSSEPDTVTQPTTTPSVSAGETAEDAYLGARRVMNAYLAKGDYTEYPTELYSFATDPYLHDLTTEIARAQEQGLRIPRATDMPIRVDTYGQSERSGVVTLQACRDARELKLYGADGQLIGYGELDYDIIEVHLNDGHYQVQSVETQVVEDCPF